MLGPIVIENCGLLRRGSLNVIAASYGLTWKAGGGSLFYISLIRRSYNRFSRVFPSFGDVMSSFPALVLYLAYWHSSPRSLKAQSNALKSVLGRSFCGPTDRLLKRVAFVWPKNDSMSWLRSDGRPGYDPICERVIGPMLPYRKWGLLFLLSKALRWSMLILGVIVGGSPILPCFYWYLLLFLLKKKESSLSSWLLLVLDESWFWKLLSIWSSFGFSYILVDC